MRNILRALRFFRSDLPRMAMVILLLVVGILANLLKPWPLAIIVDSVLGQHPLPHFLQRWSGADDRLEMLAVLGGIIFLLHAGQGMLSAGQNYLAIKVGLRGLKRVRNEVFACLQRLSMRFHQGAKAGDLIYRATWDTYAFQTLFQQGVITFLTAFLSLSMMVVIMWRLNGLLTLVAVSIAPLLVVSIRIFGREMRERGVEAQQADSQIASDVQQTIAALPLIQSYTRERHEERHFRKQTALAQEKRLRQHGWELLYWLAVAVIFGLGAGLTVWLGSLQVQEGRLTIGELLIFLAYLAQLYEPLNQLSHVGATMTSAGAGTQRVFEILDAPEEVKDRSPARPIQTLPREQRAKIEHLSVVGALDPSRPLVVQGNISFEQVSFHYQPDQPVLIDISFSLRAGESAAIIGPSGVGKTTLLHLLPRFFDPNGGSVKLEGVDLRELKLKDLRAQIALVLQEPILLPATIAENIAYGRPNATMAEIEAAAHAANADGFIAKLPRQYHTVVGEGAGRLSIGEKQRLNLARAFLKDAPILLLDEPTSALDAESEMLVVQGLHELMKGRTTLIVAHRLSTIRRVDKILTLQDGRLVEDGSPEELLQHPGYYARVVNGQVSLD